MRNIKLILTAFMAYLTPTLATATLVDRGGGLIYDSDLNITWLQDANYSMTSGVDSNGDMTWQQSIDWVESLVFAGYDDWRLPKTALIDSSCTNSIIAEGFHCTGSELGYMFWKNLSMLGPGPISTSLDPDLNLFVNLNNVVYWSQTASQFDNDLAYVMNYGNGDQGETAKIQRTSKSRYAWAVRDGDVATIPEPTALVLLAFGLAGFVFNRRKNA